MYRPVLVTPPAIKPVSLARAKEHCRIDHDTDDALVNALIAAATTYLDGWTGILGRCLVEQTWRQDFDRFGSCLRVPLFPVISIDTVGYLDASGAPQTVLASGNYSLISDNLGSLVRFTGSFSPPAVYQERPSISVTYKVGYAVTGEGDAAVAAVPEPITHAILLMVGHWYNNREASVLGVSVSDLPMAVDALLAPFRRVGV